MRLLHLAAILAIATACFADTVTLKNGRVISGTYLGGTARIVRVDTGPEIQQVDVGDIVRIEFGDPAPPPPAPPREQPVMARPARQEGRLGITLPAGTNIVIRMIDGVDSQTASTGQSFAASLDQPVTDQDGRNVIIERGADVVVKLVDSKQSGKIAGRTELALSLMSIRVNGEMVDINTQTVNQQSADRSGRSAGTIGGGAIAGAIIGGIIGGGKGAAIGAGAGGASGAAVEMTTSGQRVRVPSETRLTFVLDSPVRI